MQRFMIQAGIAAADYCQEKWLHLPEIIWELRRKRSIIFIEPPVAFLPSLGSQTPKLFPKVFTNERVSIQMPRIVWIFPSEESCSS
jgi:hypothetical protein